MRRFFLNSTCNITDSVVGWMGGRTGGGWSRWEAEGRPYHPLAGTGMELLCLQQTAIANLYVIGQGAWLLDTTCSLISAPQWHHIATLQWTIINLQGQQNAACILIYLSNL